MKHSQDDIPELEDHYPLPVVNPPQKSTSPAKKIKREKVESPFDLLRKFMSDSQRYERAVEYFENGQVHSCFKQGNIIRARCSGSRDKDYVLNLNTSNININSCSCPDWGNPCKHIGALYITWLTKPTSFEEIPDNDAWKKILEGKEKNQLVELLTKIITINPIIATKIHPETLAYPSIRIGLEDDSDDDEDDEDDEENETYFY